MVDLIKNQIDELYNISNVKLASCAAGIKYQQRDDLALMLFSEPANCAGVFTKSLCPSAPVDHCRSILPYQKVKALIVNSGNANAFTGQRGRETVKETVKALANIIANNDSYIAEELINQIYVASTGVIGEQLDAHKLIDKFEYLLITAKESNWINFAKAIMTTDKYIKFASKKILIDDDIIHMTGVAKGAGMIAPDMATMLAFIVIEADINPDILQQMLQHAVDQSFNVITVDSDMSTSDTVLLFATKGNNINPIFDISDKRLLTLQKALNDITRSLALQIVTDGEGANHLINVKVIGAKNNEAAKKIALSIANSPLVKTAIAGEDANWGRIVMAVGKAGQETDRDLLNIYFGRHRVAYKGERDPNYNEYEVAQYMKNHEIEIRVELNIGIGEAQIFGCDLTNDYVTINSDYRS